VLASLADKQAALFGYAVEVGAVTADGFDRGWVPRSNRSP
jgi:hypothetical protein